MISVTNSQDGFHHDTACVRIIRTKARTTKEAEIDAASLRSFECSEFCPSERTRAFKCEV